MDAEITNYYKMMFIYNAINTGWTVKLLANNRYEFTRDNSDSEYLLETQLSDFISKNMKNISLSK